MTVTTNAFHNNWGIGTVDIDGSLVVNGDLLFSTGANTTGNVITGDGKVKANTFTAQNVGTLYTVSVNEFEVTETADVRKNLNLSSKKATIGSFRQTGATTTIDGNATFGQFVGTSTGSAAGTLAIEETGILTITGSSNVAGQNTGSFQLNHWNAKQTVNIDGVLNLVNAGITSYHGTGEINVSGEFNAGYGLQVFDEGNSEGAITVNINEGGRVNIGADGISNSNVLTLTLNSGATLGSLADSWSSTRDLTLAGEVTVDTTKMTLTEGKATESTEAGSNVTLSGALSGSGKIIKTGAGTLTLSGDNSSLSGGVTLQQGTLVAASANALGSGNVTMSGGTLQINQSMTTSGNLILVGEKDISLDLSGALTIGYMGLESGVVTSVNINFGTDGAIIAGHKSSYGGGINFTDSDDVTFVIASNTDATTYTDADVSDLLGRVLLKTKNGDSVAGSGVNGIWNLAESDGVANALTIVVQNALGNELLNVSATFVDNKDGKYTWFDKDSGLKLLLTQSGDADGVSSLKIIAVPEPSAFGLLAGVGALALVVARRKRRK